MIKKIAIVITKTFVCFSVAGGMQLIYYSWPNLEGHAHVSFSGFPEFLIFSPAAPIVFLTVPFVEGDPKFLTGYLLFSVVFTTLLFLFFGVPKFWKNRKNA